MLEQLYAIVDERYAANRSIDRDHESRTSPMLEEQIGERTVSRLAEICDTLPLFGDDRRYAA